MNDENDDRPLLLYDGDCGFCHASVRFILDRDGDRAMRFAALASPTGHAALRRFGLPTDFDKSLVLVEGGRAYLFSAGAVMAARHLRWPWRLLTLGSYVPRPVRDGAYRVVARYRGLLAGKVGACELPKADERERFVDVC